MPNFSLISSHKFPGFTRAQDGRVSLPLLAILFARRSSATKLPTLVLRCLSSIQSVAVFHSEKWESEFNSSAGFTERQRQDD